MPEEVKPEALKLGRKDTTNNALNRITEVRIMPTCEITKRTDNYNEEESDSNSEDGSPFSPESNEAAISKFENSENLEKTQLPTLFQSMSIGSNTSADSVDSIVPEERDFGAWIESSSESSPYSSTSHSHSDSEDESSEDEERSILRESIKKKLNELGRGYNENYKATSKNNNNEEDESSSTRNISVSSKNEESYVPTSDDDSNDDSTNEDDVEVITRGPDRLHSHSGKKPYNRHSPRYENTTEALTPDDGSPYNYSIHFSPQCEESDPTSDDNSNDNYSKGEVETEVPSCGSGSIPGYHNGEIPYTLENTTITDILAPGCEGPEYGNDIVVYCLDNFPVMRPVLDKLAEGFSPQISRHSPTEETPIFGAINYGGDNTIDSLPSITITDSAALPSQSFQSFSSCTIRQPMSSASSSNSFENNEWSPRSYVNDSDPFMADFLDLGSMNSQSILSTNGHEIPCQPNYESSQDRSPEQQLYPTTLNGVGNQTNVYTQFSNLDVSMQENGNIRQFDNYTSSNIQTVTGAQMSPTQITDDSCSFVAESPSQFQRNVIQQQPAAKQIFNCFSVNSLCTSGGITKITLSNDVEPKVAAFGQIGQIGQIGQVQTNNTMNYNGGQTRKPSPKTKPKKSTILTAPSLIPPTIEDNPHLPTVLETINRQSSHEKKDSRRIAPWSLSRLPSTSAVEMLKKKVPARYARAAMLKLYDFTYDHYKEQNRMGDTYLMLIVRDSNKLPSYFAYITPVLDKMMVIPESLTIANKAGHDALYLAAINCPEYSFVTGVIAAAIEKSCKSNDIWQRKYNHGNETLLHALVARGDSHVDVLQELLAVQKASKRTLFNLSAKNSDGKTPLHVAIEARDLMRRVEVVKGLIDCGASPAITDDKNGDTPLHMAMSNRPCLEIVQALLRKDSERYVNIPNKIGNTPLDLAAGFLNNVDLETQKEICRQLIAAGGLTNICNRQNPVPFAYVAEERCTMMPDIFCKRVVKN